MGSRIGLLLLLLSVAGLALGQSASEDGIASQIEASMVVTGHVDIEADGSVGAHAIDHRDQLPTYVVELVDSQAPGWRFEPCLVDGQATPARANMSLRVVAQPIHGSDEFRITIANGTFGEYSDLDTDQVTRKRQKPPTYPQDMLHWGVEATVYMLVKVGRDGRVEDALAERVNLYNAGSEREMQRMRREFAASSERGARRWTYNPPITGSRVDSEYWTLRVPVAYQLEGSSRIRGAVGQWETYLPGPVARPAWLPASRTDGNDAMLAGQIQMLGSERKLLTPLQGG